MSELKRIVNYSNWVYGIFGSPHPFREAMVRWMHMPEFTKILDTIKQEKTEALAFQELIYLLLHQCGWAQDGFNTFELNDETVALLMATEATGDFGAIQPPYRSQMLVIPKGWITANVNGEVRDITHFWFSASENPITEGKRSVSVFATGKNSLYAHADPSDWAGFLKCGAREDTQTPAELMFRLSASFSLWMATKPGRMSKSFSSRKKKRNDVRPTRWLVGKKSKLPSDFVRTVKEAVGSGNMKGKRLSMQHVVRGHYKKQACGPRGAERKVVWVAPYWRGPDSEEAWARIYS